MKTLYPFLVILSCGGCYTLPDSVPSSTQDTERIEEDDRDALAPGSSFLPATEGPRTSTRDVEDDFDNEGSMDPFDTMIFEGSMDENEMSIDVGGILVQPGSSSDVVEVSEVADGSCTSMS